MSHGPQPLDLPKPPTFVGGADADHLRARLTHVLEYMSDGFLILSPDWRIVYVNRTAARLLQHAPAKLVDRIVWDVFPAALGSRFHVEYQRVLETGEPASFDAEYPPLDITCSVRAHRCEEGIEVYLLDIKEQVLARERLREQASLLDQARDAIFVRTLDHVVTYWNQAATRLYGWTAAEALGRSTLELINPDPAVMERVNATLLERESFSGELTQVSRNGTPLVVDASHTLVRATDGRPSRVLCINTDVTQQRRVQRKLMRAQRMESLGTLAGGIAHQLNNTLAPIVMGLDALKEDPCSGDVGDLIAVLEDGTRRASQLVQQVLAFARGMPGKHEPLDVAALVTSVGRLVAEAFPRTMTVTTLTAADVWAVVGDAAQCRQALLNLCLNARDAMPDGGELRLRAGNVTLDHDAAEGIDGIGAGDYVRVEVADTGNGMSAAVLDRIFEPFYSAKEFGERMGLGLSVVHAIVRSHAGGISVSSEPGRGATFCIYLPAASRT